MKRVYVIFALYHLTKMEQILENMVKQQNLQLIKTIAQTFGKDEEYMIRMYHTPTFYKPELAKTKKSTACICSKS